MTDDLIPVRVLSTRTIANVSETLAKQLGLPKQYRSIGLITADSDDVTYCALDEATKAAAVEVVYGRSLYAGAANASTALAGEVIGILAGPNPAEVQSGLRACVEIPRQKLTADTMKRMDGAFRITVARTLNDWGIPHRIGETLQKLPLDFHERRMAERLQAR